MTWSSLRCVAPRRIARAVAAASVMIACTQALEPETPDDDESVTGTDSCLGLACGDPCRYCAPDDPSCINAEIEGMCDRSGECQPPPVDCQPL